MRIPCVIASDYRGDPRVKITQDAPEVTLTVYTGDINKLLSLIETELVLVTKDEL